MPDLSWDDLLGKIPEEELLGQGIEFGPAEAPRIF
jgi:hypothetical protein